MLHIKSDIHLSLLTHAFCADGLALCLQIFLPLLTPHMDSSAAGEQQGAGPSPFSVLRDVVQRQGSNLTAEDIERGKGQPMEQLGVALTFGM
jgi:hypothetical protein